MWCSKLSLTLDVVNNIYTGIYNTYLSLTFYAATASNPVPQNVPDTLVPLAASQDSYGSFVLTGSGHAAEITIEPLPTNIRKAELEYFVSNHAADEFYYMNVPDPLAQPENGIFGKGVVKELQVLLDGVGIVGVGYHFPVIYTGGFNPLVC
jgi:hypothetical protein